MFGESESGKSTLLASLIDSAPNPVWLFDPQREHRRPKGGLLVRPAWRDPRNQPDTGEHHDVVDDVCRRACMAGGITVAVEEAETAMRDRKPPPWLREIIKRGRHYPRDGGGAVGFLLVSQSPGDLPPVCTSQCRDVFLFRLSGHRDLERARLLGADPEMVRALPQGRFVHIRRGMTPHIHHGPFTRCRNEVVNE